MDETAFRTKNFAPGLSRILPVLIYLREEGSLFCTLQIKLDYLVNHELQESFGD